MRILVTWIVKYAAKMVAAALVLLACLQPVQAQDVRVYFFGNSLVYHASETPQTSVPYWLDRFAKADRQGFAMDGHWGFLRNFSHDFPPGANWGFEGIDGVWSPDRGDFKSAAYSDIVITPANFIQYQSVDARYDGENPDNASPLSAMLGTIDQIGPRPKIWLYEGWSAMDGLIRRFPPTQAELKAYHAHNGDDYHVWYQDFITRLQQARPDRQIALIPVASTLAEIFAQTALQDLPAETLYLDDAPHGTPTLYFLAAAVTYTALYNRKLPTDLDLPGSVSPLLAQNLPAISDLIWQKLGAQQQAAMQGPVYVPTALDVADHPPLEAIDFTGLPAHLPRPAKAVGLQNPSLAMGLDGIADWSAQHPFIDVMKSARQWIGHLPGQWGGMDAKSMQAAGHLDADGWLKRMPPGVTHVEALILTDQAKETRSIQGRYRLTYEGAGDLRVAGNVRKIRSKPGEIRFDYAPGEGLVAIAIRSTDPSGNGDYIRNIRVIREDLIALDEVGMLFNPDWIRTIKDIRSLRFMDWMFTNGSEQSRWADRAKPTDYTYVRRGAPIEVMLELANLVGADPWFNMPHMADDAYIQAFAEMVRDGLDPRLKAYVEYSNELWNYLFPQTFWAREAARARWGDQGDGDGWMQFAGMRAAEMGRIWAEIFGDQARDRLVRVVATHTDWPGLEEAILFAPLWMAEGAENPPVDYFDAYAVTGYFGFALGTDEAAPIVKTWLTDSLRAAEDAADAKGLKRLSRDKYIRENRFNLAVPQAKAFILQSVLPPLLNETFAYQAEVAARNGLQFLMYEGGTHVTGIGERVEDQALTDFFVHFNYTPEMADIYRELLHGWRGSGGTMFNAFVDVGRPSKFGSWGALRHLDDSNPRHDALMAFNTDIPAWWESRPADTFSQGDVIYGSPGADVLAGTVKADLLLAGKGDDILIASALGDRLHGGDGDDLAYLPGPRAAYRVVSDGDRVGLTANAGTIWLHSIETVIFWDQTDQRFAIADLR